MSNLTQRAMKKLYVIVLIIGALLAFTVEEEWPIVNVVGVLLMFFAGKKLDIFWKPED